MKRWATATSLAFLMLLASSAVMADKPIGDASHCNAVDDPQDARAYIECIDAARQEAIDALGNKRHPDRNKVGTNHVPIQPDGPQRYEKRTDRDGHWHWVQQFNEDPYSRYELWTDRDGQTRRTRVSYFLPGELNANERDLNPLQSPRAYCYGNGLPPCVQFEHIDGTWRWTKMSYPQDELLEKSFWNQIARMEDRVIRVPLGETLGAGTETTAFVYNDCVSLYRKRAGGLQTEYPRRCA